MMVKNDLSSRMQFSTFDLVFMNLAHTHYV